MSRRNEPPELADLFPEESQETLEEYGEAIERYLKLTIRIADRLCLDLTESREDSNMEDRSNINNKINPNV